MKTKTETLQKPKTLDTVAVYDWLIDIRHNNPDKFDMENWMWTDDECGTVGCIAGWTGWIFDDTYEDVIQEPYNWEANEENWKRRQANRLKLTDGAANILFYTDHDLVAEEMLIKCRKFIASGNDSIGTVAMNGFLREATDIVSEEDELL